MPINVPRWLTEQFEADQWRFIQAASACQPRRQVDLLMRPLCAFERQLQRRNRAARQRARKLLLFAGSVVLAAVSVLL
jgi:hypothetical protein